MFFAITLHLLISIVATTTTSTTTPANYKHYEGYKIYDVWANSPAAKELLLEQAENEDYDVFALPLPSHLPARLMIAPQHQESFETTLHSAGLKYNIVTNNVGKPPILEQDDETEGNSTIDAFRKFLSFGEITTYLDELATKYPSRVTVKTRGKSYEGRDLQEVTITNGDGVIKKKAILIDAGIHAREWIAHATALYVITELVVNYEENAHLLRNCDWVVLPVVNPDGYEFSHTKRRMWRKTRRPVPNSKCIGIDGNRNFGFRWGKHGARKDPCSNLFMGERAFSEPETQFVRDIMLELSGRAQMYITLHSYLNCLVHPWGYAAKLPKNWRSIRNVAQTGSGAVSKATGSNYMVGAITDFFKAEAGGSDDYALGVAKILISLTMELPPGGSGFDPGPKQIKPLASEAWVAIRAMGEQVIDSGGQRRTRRCVISYLVLLLLLTADNLNFV